MREALTMDMLATDLADYLVRKGVSLFIVRPLKRLDSQSTIVDPFP